MWLFFVIIILAGFAYSAFNGAPWVPTRNKDLEYIFSQITLPQDSVVYDLGSGDGRVVFYVAKQAQVKQAVGVELAWPLFVWSVVRAKIFSNQQIKAKVKFVLGNLFKTDIHTADLVFCFLMPETMNELGPKIIKKMKPGSLLVSAVFEVNDLKPLKILKLSDKNCSYYVYQV